MGRRGEEAGRCHHLCWSGAGLENACCTYVREGSPMETREESAQATPPGDSAESISIEELRLAARNHALPLEALRYPITPTGLHYLLIHFDIPAVDDGSWRLDLDGEVERPGALSLDALRARPAVTLPVTLECAGNG